MDEQENQENHQKKTESPQEDKKDSQEVGERQVPPTTAGGSFMYKKVQQRIYA